VTYKLPKLNEIKKLYPNVKDINMTTNLEEFKNYIDGWDEGPEKTFLTQVYYSFAFTVKAHDAFQALALINGNLSEQEVLSQSFVIAKALEDFEDLKEAQLPIAETLGSRLRYQTSDPQEL
jgi:hypothetical protein